MRRSDLPRISSLLDDTAVSSPDTSEYHGESLQTVSAYLGDSELSLFDSWAQEVPEISGVRASYYFMNREESVVDPLYREPLSVKYDGPAEIMTSITFPSMNTTIREEGAYDEGFVDAWIARREFERLGREPDIGDIVHIWDIPEFERLASLHGTTPGAGYYFDVIQVGDDGHLFSGPAFVGYTIQLRRNTSFTPERRLCCDASTTDSREPC